MELINLNFFFIKVSCIKRKKLYKIREACPQEIYSFVTWIKDLKGNIKTKG